MKGDYEDFHAFGRRKNKANIIVLRSAYCEKDLKKQACPERSRMEPICFVLSTA